MEKDISLPLLTSTEREAENEANRLTEHIQSALATVGVHSSDDIDTLEAAADRIESASRDLVFALRELERERAAEGN